MMRLYGSAGGALRAFIDSIHRLRRPIVSLPVILTSVLVANVVLNIGENWELEATKHYLSPINYYGGYAGLLVPTQRGYAPVHRETVQLYESSFSFSNNGEGDEGLAGAYPHGYAFDRMFTSAFLAGFLLKLTAGQVSVFAIFTVVNLFWYGVAVWLVYSFIRLRFEDGSAAWFGAIVVSAYPVITLMFTSVKIQYAGAIAFLAGVYLWERYIVERGPVCRYLFLFWAWIVLLLSAGAWAFFLVFVLVRALVERSAKSRALAAAAVLAFLPAKFTISSVRDAYELTSTMDMFRSLNVMLLESWEVIRRLILGIELDGTRFLNYSELSFFTVVMPIWTKGLLDSSWPVVLTAVLAIVQVPRARSLGFVIPVVWLVGQAPMVIAGGWVMNYGYSHAAAVLVAAVCSGGWYGRMWAGRGLAPWLALSMLAVTLAWYIGDNRFHIENYYGHQGVDFPSGPVHIYHGPKKTSY